MTRSREVTPMTRGLGRRSFLRGALATGATVSVGLPFLETMASHARADVGASPKRFLVWFWGNGVHPDRWVPSTTGTAWTAPELLAPLVTSDLRPYVSVVTNGFVPSHPDVHAAGATGVLTGGGLMGDTENATPALPSIDQRIADMLGTSAHGLRSLELGVATHFAGRSGTAYNHISHSGPNAPNRYDRDPRSVFRRLFGMAPTTDPYDTFRGSVLDGVLEDAASLSPRLTASDRARLDQHMTSIRELERRIGGAGAMCSLPTDPSAVVTDAMIDDTNVSDQNLTLLNDTMSELLAMAFACDVTRVASYMYTGPAAFTRYWEVAETPHSEPMYPDFPDAMHSLAHTEAGDQPGLRAGIAETMRHFARTLRALAAVPDGDGTLLDQCAVLGTSCTSYGQTHSYDEYPVVVAGGAGGALRGGLHHRFASPESVARVPLTLAHAVGAPLASFGAGEGLATEPIEELLG